MTEQKSKLIYAELKNGSTYKYVWLGNDDFSKLWESWDYDSDEGKFEGLHAFDERISYFFQSDELKDESEIIGIDVEDGLEDAEIVDYELEDINWEINNG